VKCKVRAFVYFMLQCWGKPRVTVNNGRRGLADRGMLIGGAWDYPHHDATIRHCIPRWYTMPVISSLFRWPSLIQIMRQSRSRRIGSLPMRCFRGAVLDRRVHCRTEHPLFFFWCWKQIIFAMHLGRGSCSNIVVMYTQYFPGI
jgi:hypothetical protein